MFSPNRNLRFATASLLLVAIAGSGFTATVARSPCTQAKRLVARSACATRLACCCGKTSRATACVCRPRGKTPESPPAVPAAVPASLKWVAWTHLSLVDFAASPTDLEARSFARDGVSPISRSIQSLLCVWTI